MNCVAEVRSRLGVPQHVFAERLGVDQATVSRMERGLLEIDRRTRLAVKQIASDEKLDMPPELFEAA